MPYELRLPDLGEGLTEGEIARWLVAEGDDVAEDQPLVEIQTDKTTVEIPSPSAGVVSRVLAAEGDVVPVGQVILVIGDGAGADADRPRAEPVPQQDVTATAAAEGQSLGRVSDGRVRATPLVRRLGQELGVDLAGVAGTGPQGRITEEDVRKAAEGRAPTERRERIRGVRRLMGENMTRAHREIP